MMERAKCVRGIIATGGMVGLNMNEHEHRWVFKGSVNLF